MPGAGAANGSAAGGGNGAGAAVGAAAERVRATGVVTNGFSERGARTLPVCASRSKLGAGGGAEGADTEPTPGGTIKTVWHREQRTFAPRAPIRSSGTLNFAWQFVQVTTI